MRAAPPAGVGQLTSLRELRVSGNRLAALPREVGALSRLHRLAADNNLLTSIPRAPASPTPPSPLLEWGCGSANRIHTCGAGL